MVPGVKHAAGANIGRNRMLRKNQEHRHWPAALSSFIPEWRWIHANYLRWWSCFNFSCLFGHGCGAVFGSAVHIWLEIDFKKTQLKVVFILELISLSIPAILRAWNSLFTSEESFYSNPPEAVDTLVTILLRNMRPHAEKALLIFNMWQHSRQRQAVLAQPHPLPLSVWD